MAEQSEVRRRAHQVQTSPSYNVWVVVGWRLLIACRQSQRLAIADGSHPTDTVFTLYNRLYNGTTAVVQPAVGTQPVVQPFG